MSIRLVQFVPLHRDVIDREFRTRFPEVDFRKASSVEELLRELPEAEVLVINNSGFTPDVGRALGDPDTRVKWVQFTTIGIDLPIANGLPPRLPATNAEGIRSHIVATHAIALMLGAMRGLQHFQRFRARKEWARDELDRWIDAPEGGTMVIIGMGAVGRNVARMARAFEMRVVGVSREAKIGGDIDAVVPRTGLCNVLPEADVLVVAAPLSSETRHLVGSKEFEVMKPTAIVVNVSRGEVIDEEALIDALEQGRIAGAGLDVAEKEPLPPQSPLWRMENVVLSPHVAGRGGVDQNRRLADLLAENLRRYLEGRPLRNVVKR